MKQKILSDKLRRQRKFFLVLPLVVIPFLAILFVALGGGKTAAGAGSGKATGLNIQLPDAHFKKGKDKDKLSFYEMAMRDSVKMREQIKNDPYYKKDSVNELKEMFEKNRADFAGEIPAENKFLGKTDAEKNEEKLLEKIEAVKKEIGKKQNESAQFPREIISPSINPDLEKLERISRMLKTEKESSKDPELVEINSILDKIMKVQHPEKNADTSFPESKQGRPVFEVEKSSDNELTQEFGKTANGASMARNAFYGLDDENQKDKEKRNAIRATIPETQSLVSGAVIKIQLEDPVKMRGKEIPRGQMVYGIASLTNERLRIEIASISDQENIYPVHLEVYDLDGLPGIYIPGSISREAAKQSAERGVNGLALPTLDQSIGAQAASAGIEAAKSLIGKKIKLERVTVKSGYQVFLRNFSQK